MIGRRDRIVSHWPFHGRLIGPVQPLSSATHMEAQIMPPSIDCYLDFPSPYSYFARAQVARIAAERGGTVSYHPFRLLELIKIVGKRPTTIERQNKAQYASADRQRWAKRYKVEFARNPHSKLLDFAQLRRGPLVTKEDDRKACCWSARQLPRRCPRLRLDRSRLAYHDVSNVRRMP